MIVKLYKSGFYADLHLSWPLESIIFKTGEENVCVSMCYECMYVSGYVYSKNIEFASSIFFIAF